LEGVDKMMDYVNMPEDEFIKEVNELLESAQKENINIKALGALGIYLSIQDFPNALAKYKSLERLGVGKPMFTDVDVIALSKDLDNVKKFFEKGLGYKPDQYVNTLYSNSRNIYYHPKGYFHVDVFYDALRYSHDVFFTDDRLRMSSKTIMPEDFVLEKLQIHQINRKDLIDLFILFLTHEISYESRKGKINAAHIGKILAEDWGFWYDAMENLKKVLSLEENLLREDKISREDYDLTKGRISELQKIINETPKSKAWEKRARKGIAKPWYKDVDEVER